MLRWRTLEIADTLEELGDPRSTALLMWDYASGLVARALNRESFVVNSKRLLLAARECGIPVFYSRQSDMTWEDVGPGLIRMRMKQIKTQVAAEYAPVNTKGTPEGEFVEELRPDKND